MVTATVPGDRAGEMVPGLRSSWLRESAMPRRLAQHLFAAALGLVLLAGCASGPKLNEVYADPPGAAPGQARIYFYRPLDAFLIARDTDFVINGQRIGKAVSGAVFFRDARPGRYRIHTVDDDSSVIYLSLEAGDVAYVRAQSQLGKLGFGVGAVLVTPAVGRSESEGLVLTDGLEAEDEPRGAPQTVLRPSERHCCDAR